MRLLDSERCLLDQNTYKYKTAGPQEHSLGKNIWYPCSIRVYIIVIHILLISMPIILYQSPRHFGMQRLSYSPFGRVPNSPFITKSTDKHIASELASIRQSWSRRSSSVHSDTSIYAGSPSEQNNNAWNRIIDRESKEPSPKESFTAHCLLALYFNVSVTELKATMPWIDQSGAIEVIEGGYLASLEVYHHLHCLVGLPWSVITEHH